MVNISSRALLSVRGLDFSYPAYPGLPENRIFDGLDLSLHRGDIRIVLGAPECGKTTLARILTGLIPRYSGGVMEGEVRIDETDISSTPPSDLMHRIGTIFQDPDEQIFTTSCEAETAFALESLGVEPHLMRERVRGALELTGLSELARRAPFSLSGGEKKRLLFAALFAVQPEMWILDEPLDELDSASRLHILSALAEGPPAGPGGGQTDGSGSPDSTPSGEAGPPPGKRPAPGVLIFASKMLDIFDRFPVRYSLLFRKRLLHEENEGRERILELASEQGLTLSKRSPLPQEKRRPADKGQAQGGATSGRTGGPVEPGEATKETPLLSVRNLRFSYDGTQPPEKQPPDAKGNTSGASIADFRLDIPSLELYAGETTALVGPNGCGKTSLAKLLCGLLQPESGTVRGTTGQPLGTEVAYIFQNPDYQIFLPTVEDELSYGLKELGLGKEEIRLRVREAAHRFRLPSLEVPPTVMSYGARKRLQAAVYYLLERRVYIIDEADSGLSLSDFGELMEALSGTDRALFIITHNEQMGKHYARRTIKMEYGSLREDAVNGEECS